jgi:hypothetical protein
VTVYGLHSRGVIRVSGLSSQRSSCTTTLGLSYEVRWRHCWRRQEVCVWRQPASSINIRILVALDKLVWIKG